MTDEPRFRPDLYRGTASYYDRFRVPYPRSLTEDLAGRSAADGSGRLLDLACGPGLVSFALHHRFRETWAVDQEPGMIDVARQKAAAAGISGIRFLVAAAEDLALLWGGSPWDGPAPWQRAMLATMERWPARVGDRVPASYRETRRQRPDRDLLQDAGLQFAGRHSFPVTWAWTPDALAGFAYSTSVLSRAALGDDAAGFEEDLRRAVLACEPAGVLRQTIDFAYDLARCPA